ncbi:uncharacterized protein LOC116189198 isoform X2 [Punica granatum]|uniref:Uncharacterized protein LOC116189198 isoform X2 n=1 Tax=Punica granatum TaxID=22663 RepID=A0A6P8BZM9_PUNGR|nr:uncharacterized protein LOC116189198 isoform X2 [Punica granatum]XP_031374619.1 uncharacterized protein LOC116189198 isoform X2 [Punica granatum]
MINYQGAARQELDQRSGFHCSFVCTSRVGKDSADYWSLWPWPVWIAAGKLETNGIGLPTSPSSSDVQNRVLQAAARHESQPSEDEGSQEFSPESVSSSSDRGELSEA